MTIQVKIGQIYQKNPALEELMRAKLPIKISYQLGKIATQIAQEVGEVEKQRLALVEKYGEDKVLEGQTEPVKHVTQENIEVFMKEFNELLGIDVELYGDKIPLSALGNVELDTAQVLSLDWLINAD